MNYRSNIGVTVMVFNATFNNISVISWQQVLSVEKTGVPGENHRPVSNDGAPSVSGKVVLTSIILISG